MSKSKFSIAHKDNEMLEQIKNTNQKTLAIWAVDCTQRVLPYFYEKFSDDPRPRDAIDTLKEWINTGKFSMMVIRKASLDSHTAAREVGEDNPARSAARAAGQAVATAHVPTHSYGAAVYAQQAVYRASGSLTADSYVKKEREWQYRHLLELRVSQNQYN